MKFNLVTKYQAFVFVSMLSICAAAFSAPTEDYTNEFPRSDVRVYAAQWNCWPQSGTLASLGRFGAGISATSRSAEVVCAIPIIKETRDDLLFQWHVEDVWVRVNKSDRNNHGVDCSLTTTDPRYNRNTPVSTTTLRSTGGGAQSLNFDYRSRTSTSDSMPTQWSSSNTYFMALTCTLGQGDILYG